MKRILIEIEYDGRNFLGWQKQEKGRTIQGEIEKAIQRLTGDKTEIFGSGRTDKGVHAMGQMAHFDLDKNIPIENIATALNHLLPSDISVKGAKEVSNDFHARTSAVKKTYLYQIYTSQKSALMENRFSHVDFKLDEEKMKKASSLLIGRHNFQGFCCSATTVSNFEREIFSIEIVRRENVISFEICGSGFLYNMVRIIVGTLCDVGRGILTESDIEKALKTGDRSFSGVTMPPEGLFLKEVFYE